MSGGSGLVFLSKMFGPALRPTQTPVQWVAAFLLGVGGEVDRTPPSSAEVKNNRSPTPAAPV